jgi:hemerythrin superfamily protein
MNAVELLKKQHREVDALVRRFERAKRENEKEEIFQEIAARLVAHDAIEREIFYPECERVLGKIEPLMEGIAEHGLMEFSIFRADKARGKDSFEYLVSVLTEIVQHHVEEEESQVLPKAAAKMNEAMLMDLGERMEERFKASMAGNFRRPLRRNLQQVLAGRTKTRLPTKRAARPSVRKRPTRATARPRAAQAKRPARRRQAQRG